VMMDYCRRYLQLRSKIIASERGSRKLQTIRRILWPSPETKNFQLCNLSKQKNKYEEIMDKQ
jgi:hypothetical protein